MSDGLRERDQVEVDPRDLRLVVLLGTARTSRTWLAEAPGAEMRVVRRLASAAGVSPALIARVETARGVEHPSLVPPGEVWTAGAALWMSRRHRDGVSLRRLIAVTRLAPAHLLSIADDTLCGLVALHAAGVAHGSLHPGNILMAADGTAAAVDMGYRAGEADDEAGRDPRERGAAGGPGGPATDLAALAAGIRTALAPPGRRAARAGIVVDIPPALAALLEGDEGRPFGGAATAAEALAAVRAAAGAPTTLVRRQIGALVVPLQHERIGLARAGEPQSPSAPRSGPAPAPPPPVPAQADAASPPPPAALPVARSTPWRGGGAVLAARARRRIARSADALGRGLQTARRGVRRGATALAAGAEGIAAALPTGLRRRRATPVTPGAEEPAATPGGRLPRLSARSRLILWGVPVLAAVITAGVALAITPFHPPPAPALSAPAPPVTGGVAGTRPPAPATPTPRAAAPLAPNAPPTAGDVAGLSVSLASPSACTAAPGQSCLLRVTVNLSPHAYETVAWDLMVVDTCTGLAATDPGTSVPAAAGYAYVWGESPVTFATAHPVQLYAVTTAPARAASQALAVAGLGGGC